ncbi:hypothetical protein RXV94_09050 [Yeosuana sp. MJ-SS3]|uniref:Uncharacterized protein n=1 Tax=Gilvirhabdus luticola TaxID=3079858 RepID=A0ABU3U891_9FLAO|nr:hypothetical protein [Yeosuana sp. MJ-SS3]MDU8886305.1 hypothetical protein [Yeosuana sp. MJ-SS3]
MQTTDGHIVILLSNKGYVALENNEIFQLWKNTRLGDIYTELHQRYPSFEISLGSLEEVQFNDTHEVYNKFLYEHKSEESDFIVNTNFNKDLETGNKTMNTRNKAKVKAVAVIGINVTAGIMHLGFQTMADTVCYAEAKIIDKLNIFDKTVEDIMNARKLKTKKSQQSLLRSPKRVKHSTSQFYCKIRDIKERVKTNNNIRTQTV